MIVHTAEQQQEIAKKVPCTWSGCLAPAGTPCRDSEVFPQYPHTLRYERGLTFLEKTKTQVTTLVKLDKATNAELQIAADREGIGYLSSNMLRIVDSVFITAKERELLIFAIRDRGFKLICLDLENRVNDRHTVVTGHNCCLAL